MDFRAETTRYGGKVFSLTTTNGLPASRSRAPRKVLFLGAVRSFHAMSTVHFFCVLCGTALQISSGSRQDLIKCSCCSRHVPVPRRADIEGDFTSYQPVFPPEVLE